MFDYLCFTIGADSKESTIRLFDKLKSHNLKYKNGINLFMWVEAYVCIILTYIWKCRWLYVRELEDAFSFRETI